MSACGERGSCLTTGQAIARVPINAPKRRGSPVMNRTLTPVRADSMKLRRVAGGIEVAEGVVLEAAAVWKRESSMTPAKIGWPPKRPSTTIGAMGSNPVEFGLDLQPFCRQILGVRGVSRSPVLQLRWQLASGRWVDTNSG